MIFLYILLGILLFFALIFWMKIKVFIRLDGEMKVRAGYGPVVLTLVPKKKAVKLKDFSYQKHQKRLRADEEKAAKKAEKEKAKEAAKSDKKKEAEDIRKKAETVEEESDEGKLGFILDLVKFALGEAAAFPQYIESNVRMLDITVGSPEAADTAIKYGKLSAAVSLLLELLQNKTAMKIKKDAVINVTPDFTAPKTTFRVDLDIRIRLFSFVRVGWHALVWFIKRKVSDSMG